MFTSCKLFVALSFLSFSYGSAPMSIITTQQPEIFCNSSVLIEVENCWNIFPQLKINGIPSTRDEIEQVCRLFITSMKCIDNLSRACLSKDGRVKFESSIIGAVHLFKILCTDANYREEYLQHADCYQRMSPYLDNCNQKFITALKMIDHEDLLSLCCLRLRFNQCETEMTSYLCSKAGNKFLRAIVDSLMESPMEAYHSSQCKNVDYKNCNMFNSFGFSAGLSYFLPVLIISNLVLVFSVKSVANGFTMPQIQ